MLLGTNIASCSAVEETMPNLASLAVSGVLLIGALSCGAFAGPNEDLLAASAVGEKAAVEAALTQGASVNTAEYAGNNTARGTRQCRLTLFLRCGAIQIG